MTVTTTHDPAGGGHPRLVFAAGGATRSGDDGHSHPQRAVALQKGVTTIGCDEGNDICLAGLVPWHAEIHRTDTDDYVLVDRSGVSGTLVHGQPATRVELHTGTRIEMGGWVFSYAREEFADHGRPHGGRQGGEWSAGDRREA